MSQYNLGTAKGIIDLQYNGQPAADKAQEDIDGLKKAGDQVQPSMDKVGTAALAAGAAVAGGLGLAVNSAIDFDKRMSAISAVSGATGAELDALREKALQLGKDTAFSASEGALAMEELVKAGLSVDDVLNGAADATVNLAAAGEIDLPQAATIASNAMNQFGLAAQDLPRVADLIAGAANASAIDVNQFGMALSQSGAVANTVGLGFDDLATAIAVMGNAGIVGSDAGTSLKTMLMNLQPQTEKQIGLMQELGLMTEDGANKFFDAQGKIRPMSEIAGELQAALAGMTDAQRTAALETLFGSDAIRAAAVIAEGGAAGFDTMAASMGKVTAAEVAETRMGNLAGMIEEAKGSAETLAITFGSILIPALTTVVSKITEMLNWFLDLDSGTQKMIVTIAALVGGFLLAVGAFIKVVQFIKAARAAMIAFNLVLAANPIIGIIMALMALGFALVLLYNKSETFRNIVQAVWGAIKTAISATVDWIVGTAWPWLQEAWAAISKAAQELWANVQENWNGIKDTISAVVGAVVGFVTGLWQGIVGAWDGISSATTTVWDFITGIISGYVNMWVSIITTVLSTLQGWWNAFWSVFGAPITAVWELIKAIIALGIALIKFAIEAGLAGMKIVWDAFWNGLMAVVNAVLIPIWNFIVSVWEGIKSSTVATWNTISDAIGAAWDWISGIVKDAVQAVLRFVLPIWDQISSATSAAWNQIPSVISTVWGVIRAVVSSVINAVVSVISGAWDRVRSATSSVWNALSGIVSSAVNSVMGVVDGIKSRVLGVFSGAASWLVNAGRDIIQGLINGVTNMIGSLTRKLNSITDMIPDWKGPASKDKVLLEQNGELIMTGLLNGLSRMIPAVRSLLGDLTLEMPKSLGVPRVAVADSAARTATSATSSALSRVADGLAAGGGGQIVVDVDVDAPQTMSPDQVGRAVASRVGYALSGMTVPIPTPAGAF